jgi:hypothetical protein
MRDKESLGAIGAWVVGIGVIIAIFFGADIANFVSRSSGHTTCKDVTSYDYNWGNDMLCTKPDGSTFYTSYAGAKSAGSE